MKEKIKAHFPRLAINILITYFTIFLISFIGLMALEMKILDIKQTDIEANEVKIVKLEDDFIGKELDMVLADLYYLTHAYGDRVIFEEETQEIGRNWLEFSLHKNVYDKIRYIDASGKEKLKVLYNGGDGRIASEAELEDKSDQIFFVETIKLERDNVYVSSFDLNVERGEIEYPYKAMIRFSTPVYDEEGTLRGVIILNYLADRLLEEFEKLAQNSYGEMMLLNSSGYWLSCDDPEKQWGFMFEERMHESFPNEYETEWKSVELDEGQIFTENGLFTYSPVRLHHKFTLTQSDVDIEKMLFGDGKWYIVSRIAPTSTSYSDFNPKFREILAKVLVRNVLYFVAIALISLFIGYLVFINRKTYSQIKYYSEYDPLTHVYNRRAGFDLMSSMLSKDERRQLVAGLCFIDIDGLKQVNDALGHKSGDELILSVVDCIKKAIRKQDFIVRLGGDEFLVVFVGSDEVTSEEIWARILEQFDAINKEENRPYIISVSHGIAQYDSSDAIEVEELINRADEKMYQEKKEKRKSLSVIR